MKWTHNTAVEWQIEIAKCIVYLYGLITVWITLQCLRSAEGPATTGCGVQLAQFIPLVTNVYLYAQIPTVRKWNLNCSRAEVSLVSSNTPSPRPRKEKTQCNTAAVCSLLWRGTSQGAKWRFMFSSNEERQAETLQSVGEQEEPTKESKVCPSQLTTPSAVCLISEAQCKFISATSDFWPCREGTAGVVSVNASLPKCNGRL